MFIIGSVYLPPNSPLPSYELFISTDVELLSNHVSHTIFYGDLNLPGISRSNDDWV